jgi:hypothetical protein
MREELGTEQVQHLYVVLLIEVRMSCGMRLSLGYQAMHCARAREGGHTFQGLMFESRRGELIRIPIAWYNLIKTTFILVWQVKTPPSA